MKSLLLKLAVFTMVLDWQVLQWQNKNSGKDRRVFRAGRGHERLPGVR